MSSVTKFAKKALQSANIINTGSGEAPALPASTPLPVPINIPKPQPPASQPDFSALRKLRMDKLRAVAGDAGRASTILSRRMMARRRPDSSSLLEGGGNQSQSYINDVLGK